MHLDREVLGELGRWNAVIECHDTNARNRSLQTKLQSIPLNQLCQHLLIYKGHYRPVILRYTLSPVTMIPGAVST